MAGKKSSPGWLHRMHQGIRQVQRWYKPAVQPLAADRAMMHQGIRQVQRWYWHHADDWPLSALQQYGKALFVLILWLLTALGLFRLIQYLLPDTLLAPLTEGVTGVSKEAIALLGSLLTALIGFGLQQWKGQEEDEKRRREQIQQALSEIQEFSESLSQNPSEGARQYLKCRKRGGIWQKAQVQDALSEACEKAPVELRRFVAIVEHLPEVRSIGEEEAIQALWWAYESLDEEWQTKAVEALRGFGRPVPGWERRELQTIVGIWPDLQLEATPPAPMDRELIQGIRVLGLEGNPFGPEKVESQPLREGSIAAPSWWETARNPRTKVFITFPGGGRTTLALHLAQKALRQRTGFPIYWRVDAQESASGSLLDQLMPVVTAVLVRYIARRPQGLTNATPLQRKSIVRLLCHYLSEDLLPSLRRAGLPSVGEGLTVEKIVQSYAPPLSCERLSDWEICDLLRQAVPAGFPCLWILADVQGESDEKTARNFYGLAQMLQRFGVVVQVFLGSPSPEDLGDFGEVCLWTTDDLRQMLRQRLQILSGDDTLDTWCDLREWHGLPAEERLIRAANGRPAQLVCLGNEVLRCIGRTGRRLRPEDMDEILGGSP
jgi:hypothetical protein